MSTTTINLERARSLNDREDPPASLIRSGCARVLVAELIDEVGRLREENARTPARRARRGEIMSDGERPPVTLRVAEGNRDDRCRCGSGTPCSLHETSADMATAWNALGRLNDTQRGRILCHFCPRCARKHPLGRECCCTGSGEAEGRDRE